MKKKKEENLPEEGCGTKMPAENEATNEVVNNETVNQEVTEEQQEDSEDDSPDDKDGGTVEIKASGKEFLLFLSKLLRMMKNIVELQKRLQEFEKDPTFNMLLDLCMAHLHDMEESDIEKEPSGEDNDDDWKGSCDDDDDTLMETFISMRLKRLKS